MNIERNRLSSNASSLLLNKISQAVKTGLDSPRTVGTERCAIDGSSEALCASVSVFKCVSETVLVCQACSWILSTSN